MNRQKKRFLLLLTPLILSGCQSAVTTTTSSEVEPHLMVMANTVAKLRQVPCDTPATAEEQTRLAQFDPMVIVSSALHTWTPPHEFPVYLRAMENTLQCDSEQWVAQFQAYVAHSDEFVALRSKNLAP